MADPNIGPEPPDKFNLPNPCPRAFSKSFASVCRGDTIDHNIKHRDPTMHKNLPAVIFSEDEVDTMSLTLKFALVGKMRRNPDIKTLRAAFEKLGLEGPFTLGALHPGFVLINLSVEEDFNRLWTKQEWFIAGTSIRMFKWTPDFELERESSIVPVWINLPHLPCHLYDKGALSSIASAVGKPLKLDDSTANRTRPSMARICVEIDLRRKLVDQVWIKNGKNWLLQKVVFENIPSYCFECWRRGHTKEECKSKELEQQRRAEILKGKKKVESGISEKPIGEEGSTRAAGFVKGMEDWQLVVKSPQKVIQSAITLNELLGENGSNKDREEQHGQNEKEVVINRLEPDLLPDCSLMITHKSPLTRGNTSENQFSVLDFLNELEVGSKTVIEENTLLQAEENRLIRSGSGLSLPEEEMNNSSAENSQEEMDPQQQQQNALGRPKGSKGREQREMCKEEGENAIQQIK